MCKVSDRWYSLLLGAAFVFSIPGSAIAQTSLTWAKVEQLRNRVHLIPRNRNARLARVADVMSVGDALRTASSSRAELRFNDGSLARVGEQATFRFTPNTRNFQLSNGTVLLLIPPGRGRTTIQTPNAVTGIQGSALFVRVRCLAELTSEGYCSSPVTLIGALTNNPAGAMVAYNESGSQQQSIYAGEIVVIEGDAITQRHEFDLETFYETSGLAEGLQLDSSTPPDNLSDELQGVWQEIQDALELQGDFDDRGTAEEVVQNPGFVAPVVGFIPDNGDELDDTVFAEFPNFATSPAAIFHGVESQVATSQPSGAYTETLGSATTEDSSVSPVTSSRVRATLVGGPTITRQESAGTSSIGPTLPAQPAAAGSVTNQTPSVVTPDITVVTVDSPSGGEPLTPSVVDSPAVAPEAELPVTVVSEPPTVPEVTPNPGVEPAPVITATPDVVPEPAVTPTVQPTPEIVDQPPPTVVDQPVVVEQPTVVEQPPVIVEQPTVVPTIEADQVPERSPAPSEAFDLDQQQPEGASNPEVILPSLDIPVNDGQ